MADGIDASIPLGVKTPDFDATKPFNAIANLQMAQAHAGYYNMQTQLMQARLNALGRVGQAMGSGDENAIQDAIQGVGTVDPEAAQSLQKVHESNRTAKAGLQFQQTGDPSVYKSLPAYHQVIETLNGMDANQRNNTVARLDSGGRFAQGYLDADPSDKMKVWNDGLTELEKSGRFTAQELEPMRNKPNDIWAHRMLAGSMASKDFSDTSGQTSENQTRDISPTTTVYSGRGAKKAQGTPAVTPPPPAMPPPVTAPGGATMQPAGAIIPGPGTPQIMGGTPAATPAATPPAPGGKQPQAKVNPHMDEVPSMPMNLRPDAGQPGVMRAGISPGAQAMQEAGVEQYTKEIAPAAVASQKQVSELGTIESALKSGGVKTGAFGRLRETLAGFLYEAGGRGNQGLKVAQNLTGTDPSKAEILNKSSTRLGFDMARTQGAREAVQVITMALGANPNLMNTPEGALKLIGLLKQTAQWNIDRRDYADAYYAKNGHLANYDQWFNRAKPIESYTSQAVPYQLPRDTAGHVDASSMQHGVTYEYDRPANKGGGHVKGRYDGPTGDFQDEQPFK